MDTRQYIGARYVPKFYTNSIDGSAAWESNVVYEPLTYVTLTNGHMYISKKQVPATVGTPASNAEYWLDVGNYNGFIDDLQQQINALVIDVNAKANMVGIAPVEDGNNTVGSYTAGDEFYRNGVLYKAKTTIAANTPFNSLVLNTDYEAAATVSSEIKALTDYITKHVDTVSDMISASFNDGDVVITKGYYAINDGGNAIYYIDSNSASGYDNIAIADNKYAHLVVSGAINIKQLGAYGDDTHDDSAVLQYALSNYRAIYIPSGTYLISNVCNVNNKGVHIYGDGSVSKLHGENILDIDNHTNKMTVIEQLQFYNEEDAASGKAISIANNNAVVNIVIKDCMFYYCYYAIWFNREVDNITITRCYFYSTYKNSIYSFYNITHVGVYITNNHFQGSLDGVREISIYKCINVDISNNIFDNPVRTDVKHVVLTECTDIRMINNYHEVLGNTAATTNAVAILTECKNVYMDTLRLAGNIGGVNSSTGYKCAFLLTLCHNVRIDNVEYYETLLDYLIDVTGVCSELSSNWNASLWGITLRTANDASFKYFTEYRNPHGYKNERLNPAVQRHSLSINGGASTTIDFKTELPTYGADNCYIVSVSSPTLGAYALYFLFGGNVTALKSDTHLSVSFSLGVLTISNTSGTNASDIRLGVINLTV